MSAEIPDTATDAELDARMIRDVREYRAGTHRFGTIPLELAEVDALLRAVDERDRLRREFIDMPDETPAPQPAVTVHPTGGERHSWMACDRTTFAEHVANCATEERPERSDDPATPSNVTPLVRTVPTRPSYVVTICDAPHPSGDALPSLRCARRADHDGVHAKNGLTWPRLGA